MASNKELSDMLAAMQEQLATLTAERDALKIKASRPARGRETLPEVLGHSATSVMRALIALGCTGAEMNRTLCVGYQIYGSPGGMSTQVSRTAEWLKASDKTEKHIKAWAPASLTRSQIDELCRHAGIDSPATLPEWATK